jgi:hypothetical protein
MMFASIPWFPRIFTILSLATCVGTSALWARSYKHIDIVKFHGPSQWQVTSVGGELTLFSVVSRNLPYNDLEDPAGIHYETRAVDKQFRDRINLHLHTFCGVHSFAGVALCWDRHVDEVDPLAVSSQIRLLMMPFWALASIVFAVTMHGLYGRFRNPRTSFRFEVCQGEHIKQGE